MEARIDWDRAKKVREVLYDYQYRNIAQDRWEVFSPSGEKYVVDIKLQACSCPYFAHKNRICKHIEALKIHLQPQPIGLIREPEDPWRE